MIKSILRVIYLIACPWVAGALVGVFFGFLTWLIYAMVWLLIAYKYKPLKQRNATTNS